jgi:hypothetical protein
MTDIRSLERTLLDNLPWNKASIKFLARFLLALYDMWTVNREASASRILLANSMINAIND